MTEHLSQTITTNIRDLRQDSAAQRITQSNISAVTEQCQAVPKCDGLNSEDLREWIRNVDIAIENTTTVPHNVERITRKTTTGVLYRTLEKWKRAIPVSIPPTLPDWPSMRKHVIANFLGANEEDRLRAELSRTKQGPETILSFNRQFREKADMAYGLEPRDANHELLLVRAYVSALTDTNLARKVVSKTNMANLKEAMAYTDRKEATTELFFSLRPGEEMMDCSAVAPTPKTGLHAKTHEELVTLVGTLNKKVSTLKKERTPPSTNTGRPHEERRYGAPPSNPQRPPPMNTGRPREERRYGEPPQCYYCGHLGHVQRECRKQQRDYNSHQQRRQPSLNE